MSEAADGAAALDSVRRDRADLVLLDLRMPGLDGMEVLRRLRDAGNDVPVVIVSAHGSIPDVVAAMTLGAVDFLPKPVTPAGLREVVDRLARRDDGSPGAVGRESRVSLGTGLFDEDLARARRALDRGEFEEADFFLRIADALAPGSAAVKRLRDGLHAGRTARESFTYRALRELTS